MVDGSLTAVDDETGNRDGVCVSVGTRARVAKEGKELPCFAADITAVE